MNKKIKARVWDTENKCYYLPSPHGQGFAIAINGLVCAGNINSSMQVADANEDGSPKLVAELGTGLLDSDGHEIFDGDVLTWSAPKDKIRPVRRGAVSYREGAFYAGEGFLSMVAFRSQIIGNVRQNPNLVNEKGN